MPERTWREDKMTIRETVGEHSPQTPLLRKEFGDVCDGISRAYELVTRFGVDHYAVYTAMREHWLTIVPEEYLTVWEGYVREPYYSRLDTSVQVGYIIKAWFFCYEIPMTKFLRAKRKQ